MPLEPHSSRNSREKTYGFCLQSHPLLVWASTHSGFFNVRKPLPPYHSKLWFPLIAVSIAEAVDTPPLSLRPFQGQPPTTITCISLHLSFLQKLSGWAWQSRNMWALTHPERSPPSEDCSVQGIMVKGKFLAVPQNFPTGLGSRVHHHPQLAQ